MSEPIQVDPNVQRREGGNVQALQIELPPNLVTAQMVPHHLAGENGGLVRTGKIEVRIVNPITKKDAKRTVDWHATAMNCAHQTAYYKQVYDNVVIRAEEYERRYGEAYTRYTELQLQARKDNAIAKAALDLKTWWGWFLLPKSFKRWIAAVVK